MSSVLVRKLTVLPLLPSGTAVMESDWTMPHATADQFESSVLTITSTTTDEVLETFAPDQWANVVVYDDRGEIAFSFRNEPQEQRRTA